MRDRERKKVEKLQRYKGKAVKIGWKAERNGDSGGRNMTSAWFIIRREWRKAGHL